MANSKWGNEVFQTEFDVTIYPEASFPFLNMFQSNSFYCMMDSGLMKRQDRNLAEPFITSRQEYIHKVCASAVLCDKTDDKSVFAYFFWNCKNRDKVPVVYFAYVKKSFRGKGAMKYLIESVLGDGSIDELSISYPFPLKNCITDKFNKAPFFI